MKTPLEVLTEARAFISDPARWCKYESVRDANGGAHLALYPNPAQCCAYGAMAHAAQNAGDIPGWTQLWEACGGDPIMFNDQHSHAAVLSAFDRAIASCVHAKGP